MSYPVGAARKQEIQTPEWLLQLISKEWGAHWFDPCPYPRPHGFNSLHPDVAWGTLNYCNPPYNNIEPFLDRAIEETKQHNTTLLLVPARMNMRYMMQKVWGVYEIIPILGEVKFKGYPKGLPGSLLLIVVKPGPLSHQARYIMRPIDVCGQTRSWAEQHGVCGKLVVKRT